MGLRRDIERLRGYDEAANAGGAVQSSRPKVSSVALELTAHCNQKCAYCYNEWREDQGYAMGAPRQATLLARIDKLIDELDIDHFTITGGEPFAHHDVFAVLEHIHARRMLL